MSVRNRWLLLYAVLPLVVALCLGCESVIQNWDWYANANEGGETAGEVTGIPQIMQKIRVTNLNLVDALTRQNKADANGYANMLNRQATELQKFQPAVALSSPADAARFKTMAGELADGMARVGYYALSDDQLTDADGYYAATFLTCNKCHNQFRGPSRAGAISVPELELDGGGTMTPPADDGTLPPPVIE